MIFLARPNAVYRTIGLGIVKWSDDGVSKWFLVVLVISDDLVASDDFDMVTWS